MIFYAYDETNSQYDWIEIDKEAGIIRYGNSGITSPDTDRFDMVHMEDLRGLEHFGTAEFKRIDAYTGKEMDWITGDEIDDFNLTEMKMNELEEKKEGIQNYIKRLEEDIKSINVQYNALGILRDHTVQQTEQSY